MPSLPTSFSVSRTVTLLFSLLTFVILGCTKSGTVAPSGNGAGYGGGDPLPLKEARRNIVLALTELRQGFRASQLGNYAGCTNANDPVVCNIVSNASLPQKTFAKNFLLAAAPNIISMNRATPPIQFQLLGDEIFVSGPDGLPRAVSAKTLRGPTGPIFLFTPSTFGVSPLALMALLTHEFLHKILWSQIGDYVDDNLHYANGLFVSADGGGRQLNDLSGAMLSLLWADQLFGKVPVLTLGSNTDYVCNSDDQAFLFGSAPYFSTPTSAQLSSNAHYGAEPSDETTSFTTGLQTAGNGDFTVAAWVQRDTDALDEMSAIPSCSTCTRIILSNRDITTGGYQGLNLVLLQNGNFGAYIGTGKTIDSGIALTPLRFHQVVVRRTGNTIDTFVDGIKGYSDSASYGGAKGSIASNTNGTEAYLGAPALYSTNSSWPGFWKGNIAQVLLYNQAVSDANLIGLFECGQPGNPTDLQPPSTAPTHWRWLSGLSYGGSAGQYGTQGAAAAANLPGGRSGPASWTDAAGNFWLFGGSGNDSTAFTGELNDLWKYNGTVWTWVGGSKLENQSGVYGTLGVAAPANLPGGRDRAVSWVDKSGNFWLFGGTGYDSAGTNSELNDLWKYDGTNWRWMGGSNLAAQSGVYGTQGVANPANIPGARYGAIGWTDAAGNLWLFGGYGYDSAGTLDKLNDLWKFDGTSWTWVRGSNLADQSGVYGTQGVAAAGNVPGARYSATGTLDKAGNFWLFGGHGYDSNGASGNLSNTDAELNDLWKFDGTNWTWISGAKLGNQAGVYGAQGVAASANVPGGREGAMAWMDKNGGFWMFGGSGDSISSSSNLGYVGHLNDLWKFDGSKWTWVFGATYPGQPGNYSALNADGPNLFPGAREQGVTWVDAAGRLNLYGGYGTDSSYSDTNSLGDIWSYTPQ